jgi:hypothetical protein
MKRSRWSMLLGVLLVATRAIAAAQAPIPAPGSAALVEDARQWDGQLVRFSGEAIGEAMRRGDMAWIHLNDDAYGLAPAGTNPGPAGANSGIAVWVEAAMASQISSFGVYRRHGDLVEVTGTFHAACPQHGGDMDIHAASLRIIRPGYPTAHPIRPSRMIAAGILAALTLALFMINLRVDRRSGAGGQPPGRARIRPPRRDTLRT